MLNNENMANDLMASYLRGLAASTALSISGFEKNDVFSVANLKRGAAAGVGIYVWNEIVLPYAMTAGLGSGVEAGIAGSNISVGPV